MVITRSCRATSPRNADAQLSTGQSLRRKVRRYCLLGATNQDLARFFEVSDFTIEQWMRVRSEFSSIVKNGRAIADAEVANRLYSRTSHDTTACIFWLKNRRPADSRDKREVDHTGSVEHRFAQMKQRRELFALAEKFGLVIEHESPFDPDEEAPGYK